MTQRLHRSQHATFDRLGTLPECTQSSLRRERHGDLSITDGGDIIAVAAIRGTIAS